MLGIAILIDIIVVKWTLAANAYLAGWAAFYSGAVVILGCVSTIIFIDNYYSIIPLTLGHSLGSYIAVEISRPNKAA